MLRRGWLRFARLTGRAVFLVKATLTDGGARCIKRVATNIEQEIAELKRRVGHSERRIAALEKQFAFMSGQLRDIQRHMHSQFNSLRADLGIVADAACEALGQGDNAFLP